MHEKIRIPDVVVWNVDLKIVQYGLIQQSINLIIIWKIGNLINNGSKSIVFTEQS